MPGTKELLGNRGGLSDSETCSFLVKPAPRPQARTPPAGRFAALRPNGRLKTSGFCLVSRRKHAKPEISMVPDGASGCRLRRRRVLLVPPVLVPVSGAVESSAGERRPAGCYHRLHSGLLGTSLAAGAGPTSLCRAPGGKSDFPFPAATESCCPDRRGRSVAPGRSLRGHRPRAGCSLDTDHVNLPFPPQYIDADHVQVTLERQVHDGIADSQVTDLHFLQIRRQIRVMEVDPPLGLVEGHPQAGL